MTSQLPLMKLFFTLVIVFSSISSLYALFTQIHPKPIHLYDRYISRKLKQTSRLQSVLDVSIIESCLKDEDDNPIPYLNPRLIGSRRDLQRDNIIIELDTNVVIENDIFSDTGVSGYTSCIDIWRNNTMVELPDPLFGINRISKLSEDRVVIQWNVTFVPDAVVNLVNLGRSIPFWRVTFFNLLDKVNIRSAFSWQSFFIFLQRLFITGEMRLPHAVIEGTTEMKFENIDSPADDALEQSKNAYEAEIINTSEERKKILPKIWKLVSHKESLNLVQLMKKGILKNRKLAIDLLEFLDTRRPPSYGLNHWNDAILDKVPFRSVPGMKQFDIDGIEAEEQEKLLTTSNTVLGYFTGFMIVCGLGFGIVVMDKVFLRQDQQVGMQRTFANKVHKYVKDEYEEVYYDGM